jgi:hypothetical protein
MQQLARDMQRTTCNMQRTPCNMQHAVQHAAYSRRRLWQLLVRKLHAHIERQRWQRVRHGRQRWL